MVTTVWQHRVLDALTRVQQSVAAVTDIEAIGDIVVEAVCRLVAARTVSLMRWDAEAGVLRVVAARGMPAAMRRTVTVRAGEGVSGRVFAQARAAAGEGRARGRYRSRAYYAVPLVPWAAAPQSLPLGVLNVTDKRDGTAWTADEHAALDLFAHHAATYLHIWHLRDAAVRHAHWDAELQVARRMQQRTWPRHILRTRAAHVTGWCAPADWIGGDSFDYWRDGDTTTALTLDVAGHSIGAALTMASVQTVLATLKSQRLDPARLLTALHDALWRDLQADAHTVAAAVLQVHADGTVRCAAAGHPPIWWWTARSARGGWRDVSGPPLGAIRDSVWHTEAWRAAPGDVGVLVSDGLLGAWGGRSLRAGLRAAQRHLRGLVPHAEASALRALQRDLPHRPDDCTLVRLQITK